MIEISNKCTLVNTKVLHSAHPGSTWILSFASQYCGIRTVCVYDRDVGPELK